MTHVNDTGNEFVTDCGEHIVNVHDETPDCREHGCVIHNPTDPMAHDPRFRSHWRSDRGLMEYICEHGVGHPSQDQINHTRRARGEDWAHVESVHGCDGCCAAASAEHL